jgi:hypothetical protein
MICEYQVILGVLNIISTLFNKISILEVYFHKKIEVIFIIFQYLYLMQRTSYR